VIATSNKLKMRAALLFIATVFCIVGLASAAIPAHEITSLPGWKGALPTRQYSGYISVDDKHGRFLHYWLVLSENNPSTDPVVLWLNGGPGCSSLDGFFYEQGPFKFADPELSHGRLGDEVPALTYNPYSWNQISNMIFLEAPAGVGFSYSNTPSDYSTNDTQTANDNYQFLLSFFKSYPEFAANDFYITGESYAGIYVPTLVNTIRLGNNGGKNPLISLKGFAVGNGCIGNEVGSCSGEGLSILMEFLFGHGLFSQDTYAQMQQTCVDINNPTPQCEDILDQASDEVGDVNIYDIYQPCINGGFKSSTQVSRKPIGNLRSALHHKDGGDHSKDSKLRLLMELLTKFGPDECIDGIAASAYLNNDTVRAAIHVLPMNSTVGTWSVCTGLDYDGDTDSLLPLYPTLISNYRTLIYNGDADACVPYSGSEQWTESLNITKSQGWRQWLVDDQVAGYVTTYSLNNFTFLTVKGAGHMVPEYAPPQAFAMFQRFLTNQPY